MAICYPDYGEDRSAFESPGEVKFYDACKAVPSIYSICPNDRGSLQEPAVRVRIAHID